MSFKHRMALLFLIMSTSATYHVQGERLVIVEIVTIISILFFLSD